MYNSQIKIEWYSDHCYVCLDEFSEHKPRLFLFNCKHCVCSECSRKLKTKECCVCNSTINPLMKKTKNLKKYKLEDNPGSVVLVNVHDKCIEDVLQKCFITAASDKDHGKRRKCCVVC